MNGVDEGQPAGFELIGRSGGEGQNMRPGASRTRRPVPLRNESRCPIPVLEKTVLDGHHRRPLHANHRVTPASKISVPPEILFPDIQTSHKGDVTIRHDNLPMVPEIDLVAVFNEVNPVETEYLDTTVTQSPLIGAGQLMRTHRIVEKINGDPLAAFFQQE